MQKLERKLFNPFFSHIYIEKQALTHENTKKIIKHFPQAEIIEINHYKDVFSRSHQNYELQKKSQKLILGIKKDNFLYQGAEVCEDFGKKNFYYTSTMMNCIYDCEYCYLQGMYPSANIVVFVNIEDYFQAVTNLLKIHPVYLCISYDTDILAFENVVGYGKKWISFANQQNNLEIELRTKSTNMEGLSQVEVSHNVILAWTLSPEMVIDTYENKTPSLKQRLKRVNEAIEKGWKVRLCFDPILYIENWKEHYKEFIETVFTQLPQEKIYDVSIGVFRVSKDYLKRMKGQRQYSVLLNYPFDINKGVASYSKDVQDQMIKHVYHLVNQYIKKEKIYI